MTRQRRTSGPLTDGSDPVLQDPDKQDAPAPVARRRRASQRSAGPTEAAPSPSTAPRRASARTCVEAQTAYVTARDAWTSAMKAAASGRPADLAALAIAQETYEAAMGEWDRWESGQRVAITVEQTTSSVGTVVDQELAWRKLHEPEQRPGLIRRIVRRLGGR